MDDDSKTLINLFDWNDSPQEEDYWCEISNKLGE